MQLVKCLQLDHTTNQTLYAHAHHQNLDIFKRYGTKRHARSHITVWLASLMLRHLEAEFACASIVSTGHALPVQTDQTAFVWLDLWEIPEPTVELHSVRYLEICCRSDDMYERLDLAKIARLCPNLYHLSLVQFGTRFNAGDVNKADPNFHCLTLRGSVFAYRLDKVGIDLTLVPHIEIECEPYRNAKAFELLLNAFEDATEVRVNGAENIIEGRTQDGRTFKWTNVRKHRNHCLWLDAETVVKFLRYIFNDGTIVQVEIMDYSIRGATNDGRKFVWTHTTRSDYSSLLPLISEAMSLTVDVERLASFRDHQILPNLVSLTVVIGQVVPCSIMRVLFGVGDLGHLLQWPAPKLKKLNLVSKGIASQQLDSNAEVWWTLESSQLEYFLHRYLSVASSETVIVRLDGIMLTGTIEDVSSFASVVQGTTPPSALVPTPLIQQLETNDNPSTHSLDVTQFYRYLRLIWNDPQLLEDFDPDASYDSAFDSDDDIDTSESSMTDESEHESEEEEEMLDDGANNEVGDDAEATEPARGPSDEALTEEVTVADGVIVDGVTTAEAEKDGLLDDDAEAKIVLEIAEISQATGGQSYEAEGSRHDFLPEGILPSTEPFTTTFPGRQFKQLILQPKAHKFLLGEI